MKQSRHALPLLVRLAVVVALRQTAPTAAAAGYSYKPRLFPCDCGRQRRLLLAFATAKFKPRRASSLRQDGDDDYDDKQEPTFSSPTMPNISLVRCRARVAYDGSRFLGWQYQASTKQQRRTVQGLLEHVLSTRFNRRIRIVGAGRTDAGVHARGQAIHFDLRYPEEWKDVAVCENGDDNRHLVVDSVASASQQRLPKLQHSMNRMLQSEPVRVWNVSRAPAPITKIHPSKWIEKTFPWHVIYNANQKLYSYRFCTAPSMDPLERHTRYHVDWGPLDMVLLERILQMYVGTHDFRAFAGAIEQKERKEGAPVGTERTVYQVDLICEDEREGMYRIDILLKGALYKQVRNMVGTAIEVCRGRMDEATFCRLLYHESDDDQVVQFVRKDNPCKPAPPQGLTLEKVFYDGDF